MTPHAIERRDLIDDLVARVDAQGPEELAAAEAVVDEVYECTIPECAYCARHGAP